MTAFVIATSLLTLLTLLLLVWPLLRRRRDASPQRARFDLAVYRDQLEEVERDLRRGVLRAGEADAARVEVKRRMLAAAASGSGGTDDAAHPPVPPAPPQRSARAAIALLLLVPVAAAVVYLELGAPDRRDEPLAERRSAQVAGAAGIGQPESLEQATAQLAKRLEATPNDVSGWYLLGRAYLALQRPADAVAALGHALALAPDEVEVVGAYAQARVAAAGGQVDDEARAALQKMVALDPASPQARFLLALDRAQQGDLAAAMQGWVDLIAIDPPDAPWLPSVREHLQRAAEASKIDAASVHPSTEALALSERLRAAERAEAATAAASAAAGPETGQGEAQEDRAGGSSAQPGPSAADVAAAQQMSAQDRAQMIRSMVDRLATRLQENPDDLEGWRRLARAYDVLGETGKAAEARKRIAALEAR